MAWIVFNVGDEDEPDEQLLDMLARLQLAARAHGFSIVLEDACPQLIDLLDLVGLREVLPVVSTSDVKVRGHAEEREERGVDEEVDPGDPVV